MSDQEIIIEVAKLDGYLDVKEYNYNYDYCGEQGEYKQLEGRHSSDLGILKSLPNYLTSRDAIIPVIEKQGMIPRVQLVDFVSEELFEHCDGSNQMSQTDMAVMLCATPRQLCIALLKATGKYHD